MNTQLENQIKKALFDNINIVILQNRQIIQFINNSGKYVQQESELPNIGITLNNKLVELQFQFQDAGLSIYSHRTSVVGQAVIFDLIAYATKGMKNLEDYSNTLEKITKRKERKKPTNPISKFLLTISDFVIHIPPAYTQEETNSINSHLKDYKETNNQLWRYNLKNNIISSILTLIRNNRYSLKTILELLEKDIIPILEKLGLADLIPHLLQKLIKEYETKTPNNDEIESLIALKRQTEKNLNKSNQPANKFSFTQTQQLSSSKCEQILHQNSRAIHTHR